MVEAEGDDENREGEEVKVKKHKKSRKHQEPREPQNDVRVTELEVMLKQSSQQQVIPTVPPRLPKVVLLVLLGGAVMSIDAIIVIAPLFRDMESHFYFGLALASYHVGQILSTPLLGYWSDGDHINRTLVFSSLCGVAGNLVFAFAERDALLMCVGRFVVGLGAGNILVPWVQIRALSNKKQREERFVLYGWCMNIGKLLGAGLGLLGQLVLEPFRQYLIPGFLMAAIFSAASLLQMVNWLLVRRQGGLAIDPEDFDQSLETIRLPPSQNCFVTQKLLLLLLLFGLMNFSYWYFVAAILPSRAPPSQILWSESAMYVWLLCLGGAGTLAHGALQLMTVGPARALSVALALFGVGSLILFHLPSDILDWQIFVATSFVSAAHSWLGLLAPRIIDTDRGERIGFKTSWFFIGIAVWSAMGALVAQWLADFGLSLVGLLNSSLMLLAMALMIFNPETKSAGKTFTSLNQPLLD